MTSLVEIIREMTTASGRTTRELPRGLWLVYYPAAGDAAARLIAGRYLNEPSPTELQVVWNALLEALDAHPSLVVEHVATDWQETSRGDWHGYAITWTMLSTSDLFSDDLDMAQRIRRAIDHLRQRELKRRADRRPKAAKTKKRAAATRGPKPML